MTPSVPRLAARDRLRRLTGPVLLALGILGALIGMAGFGSVARTLEGIRLPFLMPAALAYAVSWGLRTWRLSALVSRAGRRVPPFTLFRIGISAAAFNAVLPARAGDAANVLLLNGQGVGLGPAAAVVLQSRVLDATALVTGALPALIDLTITRRLPTWVWGAVAFGVLVAMLPFTAATVDRFAAVSQRVERWVLRRVRGLLAEVVAVGSEAWATYHRLVVDRPLWLITLALSAALAFGEALTSWSLARAVGAHVGVLPVLSAIALGSIGKGVPVTPGGIGVYEAVCAAVLSLFGVAFEVAVAFAILDHGLKKAVNVLFGLALMRGSQRTDRPKPAT